MEVFTYGLPLVLFIIVVIISYIFIASPCDDAPQWRECVPTLAVSLYYYDHNRSDCFEKDMLPKGCLNDSNGFADLQQCQQTCTIPHETNAENLWSSEPVSSLQKNRPDPNNNPSPSNKLPPKRCRTVTLDKCDANSLKPSVVYNPVADTCSSWQYSKGCYRNKNIFFTLDECQAGCSRTSSAKLPNADDCVSPDVGEACDDRLLQMQFFFNPLRSSCENLTDLCLAGRNRFLSYQECTEACMGRDDSRARRRHQASSHRDSR
ncbi:hypothetical protein HPB52_013523 [Rhipicephalus sanguineus]|uniref:BPTI/Kunitz inhibitor domain-containing protein n=1 Tax=Rhipicephalus sanguineus TaxID=34632 RepID=A0A9D4PH58_RHISA|nr:hypothetical protein HPB52_013523 [Rhipicephalus sanguineus]